MEVLVRENFYNGIISVNLTVQGRPVSDHCSVLVHSESVYFAVNKESKEIVLEAMIEKLKRKLIATNRD